MTYSEKDQVIRLQSTHLCRTFTRTISPTILRVNSVKAKETKKFYFKW